MRKIMLAVAVMTGLTLVGGTAAADVRVYPGACWSRPGCSGRLIGYYYTSRQCWTAGGRSWYSHRDRECYDRFPM